MDSTSLKRLSDHEVERYVLGACLVWPDDYLAASRTSIGERFPWTAQLHAEAWAIMCKLQDEKRPILFSEIITNASDPRILGPFLESLVEIPTGAYCGFYVKQLLHNERRRIVGDKAKLLMESAATGAVNGELDELTKAVHDLDNGEEYRPPVMPVTALDLFTMPPIKIDWLLKPVLARGKLTQLQGEPKSGKSVFALYCSICAAIGHWIAGEFESFGKPLTILFISSEDASNILQQRVIQFFNGLGLGNRDDLLRLVVYPQEKCAELGTTLDTDDGRRLLEQLVKYAGADIVVLDSLSNFNTAEENSKKEMQPVMSRLRLIALNAKCALMYLHHTGKVQPGLQRSKQAKSRGSGVIAAAWDILIDWCDRGDTNTTPFSVMSKLGEEGSWDMEWMEDKETGTVKWSMGEQLPKENSKATMKKILAALNELSITSPNGVKIATIASAVGITPESVRAYLENAFDNNQVNREKGEKNAWFYSPIPAPK